MSTTDSMSIRPRESAVTAALAGAVVVVLAYASGFGLRTPLVAAPLTPAPTLPGTTVSVPTAVPAATLAPMVITAVAPSKPQPVASATPSPHVQPVVAPPIPTPTPAPCTSGVVGSLLQPVGSLIDGLLGADLLDGGLSCTLDGLLGSGCCSSPVAAKGNAR